VIRTAYRSLSTLVILLAAAGCDNVSWGGFDVSLQAPPERESEPADDVLPDEPALPTLPSGPVLFRVERAGGSATLSPVGEIGPDGLQGLSSEDDQPGFRDYFAQERMAGHEFVLFADGVRVGRFLAGDSIAVDGESCTQPPVVGGIVELVPEAAGANRLLALDATNAGGADWSPYAPTVVDQGWRSTAANVAGTVIMDAGARWPPSMAGARGDVQVTRFREDEPPLLAGTYLYQDQMAIVEADPASYSFFYLAENRGTGYRTSYYWFRVTANEGKGAARLFGHMDWDGDGREDVLLEVLGADARWHAALARTDTGFERTFQDACGSADRQAPPGE
jgi:hypothetical protein